MAVSCPLYGKALYLDCLECDNKVCRETSLIKSYKEKVKEIQKRSKIWNIYRSGKAKFPYTVGMNTFDGYDIPYSYNISVYGYEITSYSGQKAITVYKKKWYSDYSINLYHFYFVSDGAPETYYSKKEKVEEISQEELAKLANRDWLKCFRLSDEYNRKMVEVMKIKYIKTLEYHKQIKYSEYYKKYVSYDYYMYSKECGWRI